MLVVAPGALRSSDVPTRPMRLDADPRVAAVVIDSQELFRAALGALLSRPPVMANVRSVSGCDGADALLLGGPADLVLCEVRSDSADGVRLAYELADRFETTAVILVAEPGQEDLLIAALGSPAAGFFTKDSPVEDFLFGVQTVLTGHRAVSEAVMKRLTANLDLAQPVPDDPFAKLSPSEMQILRSVGEGETVANIAAGRGIATKTVRNHLASIYQKLEVRSRTEAILFVARAGASAGSRTKM